MAAGAVEPTHEANVLIVHRGFDDKVTGYPSDVL